MINIIDGGVTAQKGLKPQESPAGLKTTKKGHRSCLLQ